MKISIRGLLTLFFVFGPFAAALALVEFSSGPDVQRSHIEGRMSIVSPAHEQLISQPLSFQGRIDTDERLKAVGIDFHNPSASDSEVKLEATCEGGELMTWFSVAPPDNSVLFFTGYSTAYFIVPAELAGRLCEFVVYPGRSKGVWVDLNPPWEGSGFNGKDGGSILPSMVLVTEPYATLNESRSAWQRIQ